MAFCSQRQSEHLCALERHRHELHRKNSFSCQRLSSSLATKVAKRRLNRQKTLNARKDALLYLLLHICTHRNCSMAPPTRVTRRYRHIPGWCHLTWLWTNAGQHILAVHLTQIPGEWDWGLYHHGHNLQPRWQRGSHFTTKSGGVTFNKSGCLIKFSVSIWTKNFSFVLCWLGLCIP